MVTKWAFFIWEILFFSGSFFPCFATRPSHCPTVGFFFRGGIVLRWGTFFPTQGKRGASRFVQHSAVFDWQRILNLKADQLLFRERIPDHAVRPALVPVGIFVNHPDKGHALDFTAAELIQLSHSVRTGIPGFARLHCDPIHLGIV